MSRKRMAATRIERHVVAQCPECHYRLRGESLDYRREVIELPPAQPVEVIEHQVVKRWCPHCAWWRSPQLDLHGQVLGQGRIGVRVAALVAYLRTSLRLPVRQIQTYLATHALHYQAAWQLGQQYAFATQHPCWALAKRRLRHQDELFLFVLLPGVPADNNLAERSLRPIVIMRKISGGTRSPAGSQTRLTLASLFGTWHARGLNCWRFCKAGSPTIPERRVSCSCHVACQSNKLRSTHFTSSSRLSR